MKQLPPPQQQLNALVNLQAEQAVLGACLWDNRLIDRLRLMLQDWHFADALHARIWLACLRLVDNGTRANVLTLKAAFDQDEALIEIGGAQYLAKLTSAIVVTLPEFVEDFARVIIDLAIRRRAIERFHDAIARVQDVDTAAASLLSDLNREIAGLISWEDDRLRTKAEIGERIVAQLKRPPACYSTGLPGLDLAMGGGLYAGKTYGIAARKKVGKTVMLGTISDNLEAQGVPHVFFAHEMTPEEIETRNMARHLRVNPLAFLQRRDGLARDDIMEGAADIAVRSTGQPGCVYARASGTTLDDVQSMLAAAIVRFGVKGAMIDYWQLIHGKRREDTEEYHMRRVAEWFSAFGRRSGLWFVIAAQVNQDGNTRGGEGLRLAADQYYALLRDPASYRAWMDMQETRYTPYRDVGSEQEPGLLLHSEGPWFEDVSVDPPQPGLGV